MGVALKASCIGASKRGRASRRRKVSKIHYGGALVEWNVVENRPEYVVQNAVMTNGFPEPFAANLRPNGARKVFIMGKQTSLDV